MTALCKTTWKDRIVKIKATVDERCNCYEMVISTVGNQQVWKSERDSCLLELQTLGQSTWNNGDKTSHLKDNRFILMDHNVHPFYA